MANANELLKQGWQLHQSGDIVAARRCYDQALTISPDNANAMVYRGIAQFDQREFADSAASYRNAIAVRSEFPIAWNNLGNSLRMLGDLEEAESCFAEALKLKPGYLSALKNRGTLWVWAGEIERGLGWYEEGLKVDPDNAELHRNLGVIHLLLGNYERGWNEYRWRWRMPGLARPHVAAPAWKGESLQGKTILIYPEQGLGDTLQFVRVAGSLQALGARVIVRCSDRMLALFTSAPHVDQLVLDTKVSPPCDYHASMIEVIDVLYCKTGQIAWGSDLFNAGNGYLTVSADLIDYWRQWLDQNTNTNVKRIGINWQGNPEHHADVYRSIPLETLAPLAGRSGIELISLQFGKGAEQLENCKFAERIRRLPDHVDTDGGAFTDTAAILKHLDGVVTTDTAIAHLAGAVGAPVMMMVGRVPDWRWLEHGESTRWYPSMQLIRQQQLGAWDDVVAEVAKRLDLGHH